MSAPKRSSPLRKVAAFYDLPSLASPERLKNQPSYPGIRPSAGERIADGSLLPPISPISSQTVYEIHVTASIDSWLSGIPDSATNSMFQFPEKKTSIPSSPRSSPPSWSPKSRMGPWTLTPRKVALIAGTCLGILLLNSVLSLFGHHRVGNTSIATRTADKLPSYAARPTLQKLYHTTLVFYLTLPFNRLSRFLIVTLIQLTPLQLINTVTLATSLLLTSTLHSHLYVEIAIL